MVGIGALKAGFPYATSLQDLVYGNAKMGIFLQLEKISICVTSVNCSSSSRLHSLDLLSILCITAVMHHVGPVIPSSSVFGDGESTSGYTFTPVWHWHRHSDTQNLGFTSQTTRQ
jgi:hypothetical protein